jgi:hypothetical protein
MAGERPVLGAGLESGGQFHGNPDHPGRHADYMVIPTILVAMLITWHQRQERFTFIHNLAITVWISSNSLWMLAEFYEMESSLKPVSTVGFAAGLLILLSAYFFGWMRKWRS